MKLLLSDKKGKIFEHPTLEGAGMKARNILRLDPKDLVKLPVGSQLFSLPGRHPVGYDRINDGFIAIDDALAVAAFASPAHTTLYSAAYMESGSPVDLPLFSYCAAVSHKGDTYIAAIKVDNDIRHDSTLIDISKVKKSFKNFRKIFPNNRLIAHLERCAVSYGCPNAQNFFLSRFECPLPSAPLCNAACAGCISYQSKKDCKPSQPRISFIPRPEEISEIALYHINNAKNAIVSFGQGCEGEPLTQSGIIKKAIREIRRVTDKGTINMNTNGSRPDALAGLFDAGLDSVRISMNSAREEYYKAYYRPSDYSFNDVLMSITTAKEKGAFVSLNYLTMPGFTDSKDEFAAFRNLLAENNPDMVQWRNLNYDPLRYFDVLKLSVNRADMIGINTEMALLKKEFSKLRMGYFNPSKIKGSDPS